MKYNQKTPSDREISARRARRLEAMHLQKIEGDPLDDEQVEMFEMFERDRWTDDQIKAHLDARARSRAQPPSG
jgi:hypothetical protein